MDFSALEKELFEDINTTNWNNYQGPEYYQSKKVITSLVSLVILKHEREKWNIYNDVLFAIGNNHGGTYYPAVLKALPIIIKLISKSECELVRNCGLEIITDLYSSFEPELGSFNLLSKSELESFVRNLIKEFVEQRSTADSERNEKLLAEFGEFISQSNNL